MPTAEPAVTLLDFAAWKRQKRKIVVLEGPGEYTIECAGDPVDEWIELEIPSSRR